MVQDDEMCFSEVAEGQLDELEALDPTLHNKVLDACDLIVDFTGQAQNHSSVLSTDKGLVCRLPAPGAPTHVYWTAGPPARIEALFPLR